MNFSNIPGYTEDLSAEEVLELLKAYEPEPAPAEQEQAPVEEPVVQAAPAETPEPTVKKKAKAPTGYVHKDQADKYMSEIARLKRELRSHQTEEEQKESERREQEEQMRQQLAEYQYRERVSDLTANYMQLGYSAEMARQAAETMAGGDTEGLFDLMAKHKISYEKSMREKILKDTPVPPASSTVDEAAKAQKEQKEALDLMMGR